MDIIDLISIISVVVQIQNMKGDEIDKVKNNFILKAFVDELGKLHKENESIVNSLQQFDQDEREIVKQLDIIIFLLSGKL